MSVIERDQTGIRANGLTKSYGSVQAVRGIDLVIAPGETVALLGPNGAGKTTTIDMVLGLTRPDAGEVAVFGVPPATAVRSGWVGGMLQIGSLPDHLRVRELLSLVASYYPHPLRVDDVLALTGLGDVAERWTRKLSGGQAQRVRFGTALVSNSDLLVLDEPTAGIDVEGRHEFWQAMRGVAAEGKTVVFATHYLEEADAFADRIVLIARGSIVADGPATEIKAKAGSRTVRATLPGIDLQSLRALAGCDERRAPRRHGGPVVLGRRRCACGAVREVPAGARRRSTRREPRGSVPRAHCRGRPPSPRGGGRMSGATHVRYELLRTVRNRLMWALSLALPLVVYYAVASGNRHAFVYAAGVSFPLYFMTGMAAYGAMFAAIGPGARLAATALGAGPASCGSRHCGPAPTTSRRRSPPTSWRCPRSSWSSWPAQRLGCASTWRSG